jgi:uncharacterized protein YciI
MKKVIKTVLITMVAISFFQQATAQNNNANYNLKLATELGADDYGMRSYVLVILKTGSNKTTDKILLDSLFAGHMSNMTILSEQGKLIVAGPFQKNRNNFRGLFILNTSDTTEARKMVKSDPAVNAGVLDADLYPWYGSAALPVYLETHKKIQKSAIK